MTKFADLHIHTHFSDSASSPREIVDQALAAGITCIGITDHDTVEGIEPTTEIARDLGIEVIPGIEFSTEIHGKDVHILGYCFDVHSAKIKERIVLFQSARVDRVYKIIDKLRAQGIDNITPEEVLRMARSDSVGRPHVATLLVEKGWVKDLRQAFDKYLADESSCFVPKYKQTPTEAIALIKEAGGVAVLAHPMVTNKDELIPGLIKAGLDGLEVFYPNCSEEVTRYYEGLAKKHHLLMTGGSDDHGEAKNNTFLGKVRIPYAFVEQLKTRACQSP